MPKDGRRSDADAAGPATQARETRMNLRAALIVMTLLAVVSDTLLDPFYPQYFETVLGVSDAQHVGIFIAACVLTVMLSFPVWARISRHVQVLPLLVGTQLVTGVLCLVCAATTSLVQFWILSLIMMLFKASYLLIYPYVMSLEDKKQHFGTIGLLALMVYFGRILSALLSGVVFEWLAPRSLFVVMACGDALQMLVCLYMLRMPGLAEAPADPVKTDPAPGGPVPARFVLRLGLVMFVLYFSAYLSDPFFSTFWEQLSANDSKIVSGVVFALPGIMAIAASWASTRLRQPEGPYEGIAPAIVAGACGLWLQASGEPIVLFAGRMIYGWALFLCMVRLDLLLFRISRPATYAVDFSRIHLFQSLGTLCASFCAGSLVLAQGPRVPLIAAGGGFVLGVALYGGVFLRELRGTVAVRTRAAGLIENVEERRAIS